MDFTIRDATADDQAFITEMQYEAFFVPPGSEPFPLSILDEPHITPYHLEFGTRTGDAGVIAVDPHGHPLGAAWVRQVEGYGFVDHETPELGVAVIEMARGHGIGTALMEAMLHRVPRCSLSVDIRNPALRLYERLGFEPVGEPDGTSVVMLRDGRS